MWNSMPSTLYVLIFSVHTSWNVILETGGFTVGVGVTIGVVVTAGVVGVGVGVFVGVTVGVDVGVGVVVLVGVGVVIIVGATVILGETLGVALGVTPPWGSVLLVVFCDWDVERVMKSEALSFESSAFPNNISAPVVMLRAVDDELAFLSTLAPSPGFSVATPSPTGFAGVPMVTASMIAPVSAGSCLKTTLLSSDIVPEELASQLRVTSITVLHQRKYP